MKKLLFALIATAALFGYAYPKREVTVTGDTYEIERIKPYTLKSLFIKNNGSAVSKSETVTVKKLDIASYNRYYAWRDIAGTTKYHYPDYYWMTSFSPSYGDLYEVKMVKDETSDDPNRYHGEKVFEHYTETNTYGYCVCDTYTDPVSFKLVIKQFCTNSWTTSKYEHSDSKTITDKPWNYCGERGASTYKYGTNDADIVWKDIYTNPKQIASVKTNETSLASLSAANNQVFAITNDMNVFLPSGTKLKISKTDQQNEVGFILEN